MKCPFEMPVAGINFSIHAPQDGQRALPAGQTKEGECVPMSVSLSSPGLKSPQLQAPRKVP